MIWVRKEKPTDKWIWTCNSGWQILWYQKRKKIQEVYFVSHLSSLSILRDHRYATLLHWYLTNLSLCPHWEILRFHPSFPAGLGPPGRGRRLYFWTWNTPWASHAKPRLLDPLDGTTFLNNLCLNTWARRPVGAALNVPFYVTATQNSQSFRHNPHWKGINESNRA